MELIGIEVLIVFILFIRGRLLFEVDIKITYLLYMSYCLFDSKQLLINKNRRIELWLHHFYTFFAYRQFYYTFKINDYFVSHLYLLGESLSICNANLRKKKIELKRWRLFTILFLRLPIWIYSSYIIFIVGNIDKRFLSLLLYYSSPLVMMGIDYYL